MSTTTLPVTKAALLYYFVRRFPQSSHCPRDMLASEFVPRIVETFDSSSVRYVVLQYFSAGETSFLDSPYRGQEVVGNFILSHQ